jgi:hypothetical protein
MTSSIARARYAVGVIFFMNGAVLASWVPHIPEVKALHGLSDGTLGVVLLALAAGAILAMPVAGALIGTLGSRTMTTIAALALTLLLPLPLVSPTVPALTLALDHLAARFGTASLLPGSSALAAVGLVFALVVATPAVAIAGFGAVGFGIANVIPLLFRAAGNIADGAPGAALAAVATTGYAGFLAGPVLIGCTAQLTTLPIGLALVSLACTLIAVCSGIVRNEDAAEPVRIRAAG